MVKFSKQFDLPYCWVSHVGMDLDHSDLVYVCCHFGGRNYPVSIWAALLQATCFTQEPCYWQNYKNCGNMTSLLFQLSSIFSWGLLGHWTSVLIYIRNMLVSHCVWKFNFLLSRAAEPSSSLEASNQWQPLVIMSEMILVSLENIIIRRKFTTDQSPFGACLLEAPAASKIQDRPITWPSRVYGSIWIQMDHTMWILLSAFHVLSHCKYHVVQ